MDARVLLSDRAARALEALVSAHGIALEDALRAVGALEDDEDETADLGADLRRCLDVLFDELGVADAGGAPLSVSRTCPHAERSEEIVVGAFERAGEACERCGTVRELWTCRCGATLCGRYQNACMKAHAREGHELCVSWDDLSVWCYGCASYIDPGAFDGVARCVEAARRAKFSR